MGSEMCIRDSVLAQQAHGTGQTLASLAAGTGSALAGIYSTTGTNIANVAGARGQELASGYLGTAGGISTGVQTGLSNWLGYRAEMDRPTSSDIISSYSRRG